ncbi:hypothetical protein Ddye_007446 [Dipteronia dyeriana]|uniref:B3 domain-containing protein n=1 Tax=Dipteronia dyeriana TaxID=168575 RepID=A0AAE0CS52_9ROSI|nr:hypothetical protein Ddye_007446 [Dipteronia dyeriana]
MAEGSSSKTNEPIARIHDDAPPELRNHNKSTFNGTDILLVMEKEITASDIDRKQNRLLFGVNKSCLEITEVELRKRTKKDSRCSAYVLTGNWYQIAEDKWNGVRENVMVRLWSFRKGSDLYFALEKA